ncbi:MAG: type II CAAX endopeptidase family protein [Candidatus ainarchaeum sp.]|nr:type II CAAX endopeptidase family protein [Candidatus ainarchaeum sp.]MDD5096671.1 type II CAAX endopeptidase family protein [Candidatus ainarchaeum sp.]
MKNPFLSLFSAFFIFFALSFVPGEFFMPLVAVLTLLLAVLLFRFYGNANALAFLLACVACLLVFPLSHSNTLYLQMAMGTIALHFIWKKGDEWWQRGRKLWRRVAEGIGLAIVMVVAGAGFSVILSLLGLNDGAKAVGVVEELPIYLLVASFTLVPVTEELFFRALMVPWLGVFGSAIFFGLTHTSYGSVAEILGAAFLGLILAYYFSRSKDLLPCIIAHAIFNFSSVFIIKMLAG